MKYFSLLADEKAGNGNFEKLSLSFSLAKSNKIHNKIQDLTK